MKDKEIIRFQDFLCIINPLIVYVFGSSIVRFIMGQIGLSKISNFVNIFVMTILVVYWFHRENIEYKQRKMKMTNNEKVEFVVFTICLTLFIASISLLVKDPISKQPSSILNLISIVFLGPICEEYLFRGLLFLRCKKVLGNRISFFSSSILFGIAHADVKLAIVSIFVGMILCYLYLKYQNLNNLIILHICLNLFSYVKEIYQLSNPIYVINTLILGALIIREFRKNKVQVLLKN